MAAIRPVSNVPATVPVQAPPPPPPQPAPRIVLPMRKYYPKATPENQLSRYFDLLESKDEHVSRSLLIKLANQYRAEQFKIDMGLKRNVKCQNCTSKDPCDILSYDDIHSLLISSCNVKSNCGMCKSCGIELTMWDESRDKQLISSWNICTFDINSCKTKEGLGQLRIFCRGCCAFAELCYYDFSIMNYYRRIVFHMTGNESPGYYFPKVESIDEKDRSVVMAPNKKCFGTKVQIMKHWPRQEGFVVYELPQDLEAQILKDTERKDLINSLDFANDETNFSKYYGDGDLDIKLPTKVVRINPNAPVAAKKRKLPDEKKKKSKVTDAAELFRNQSKYVVFKIPIDPRKSMKKKSLSALAVTPMDRKDEMKPGNSLFTTRLLAALEERFDYEEFIRWGLDYFRVVTPHFIPKKVSEQDDMHVKKFNESDQKALQEIKGISIRSKARDKQVKALKSEIKQYDVQKNNLVSTMRSKIISLIESNDSMEVLTNQNLVATMAERKADRVNLKKEYVASRLPFLLMKYGLVSEDEKKEADDKCAQIAEDLFDSAKITSKKTTFSLKYVDPEEEQKKKDNLAQSKKNYTERKKEEKKK
jgi:hypothetical protein